MSTTYGQLNDHSGTITTNSTSQVAVVANPGRRYLLVVNQSAHPLYVDFGAAATNASIPLPACSVAGDGTGGSLEFKGAVGDFVPTGSVNLFSGTATSAFTVKEG